MDKDYTNLKHLDIRLPEYSDGDLLKAWAKDYYDNKMMSEKSYEFWLSRDYDVYFKEKEVAIKGESYGAMEGVYCYTYYLIENEAIVGIGSLRLNPLDNAELSIYGGHIGYGIIPSKRKSGHGTMFLHLLIKKAAEFGLKEIMVVCEENNLGSIGIIENNFGVFKDMVFDSKNNVNFKRYIIDVGKSIDEFERRYFRLNSKQI
ncbi:MAG: GNAT family N-acetyltransferase [Bacilli bacterium]|nr:GNAT family N-acetyltransferase [Bacilli bacterium]